MTVCAVESEFFGGKSFYMFHHRFQNIFFDQYMYGLNILTSCIFYVYRIFKI
jgi:hypothetical protein